jgi:tetratricopeptide (TPR) repeat protein
MATQDLRGNPVGSGVPAARDAAELALWRMMSFYDTPLADLDAAMGADPGWALPHTMKAGFLLSLTEPALLNEAAAHLSHARALSSEAPARERAHLDALQLVLEGRWHAACRVWDELLVEHPRDALALQWAQLWDFYRGDTASLRQRPARALPEWDETDPLQPFVLGLLAFGLEENNLYPQAEEAGRRALASDPRVPWAVHAVAHVMEMQGRFEDGSAWLRQMQPHWADGNGFASHLWWHKGLFRLEAMDLAGALRLVDAHLAGDALQISLQRVDAASLLWRLHLLGQDMQSRFAALVQGWPLLADEDQATAGSGYYAFNDVHAVLALLGAGEVQRAEGHLARCAARALTPEEARRSNHAMAREVGLPLMRGLLALARGDADAAAELIYPVRAQAQRLGGSHAQRDLIDQTLLAAAAASGHQRGGHGLNRQALGRALLNERMLAKPVTPLTRHWLEAVGEREEARA